MGDPRSEITRALRLLGAGGVLSIERISSLYLTAPVECPPQPDFLNVAVLGKSGLSPRELLWRCLGIENSLGRKRGIPRGPRLIDIDILFFGNIISDGRELTLPHPAIPRRMSILVPLAEICPSWKHPVLGMTARQMAGLWQARGRTRLIPS